MDINFMDVLSNVIQIVLEYLLPVVISWLVVYLGIKLKPILENETVKIVVKTLVGAAEQIWESGNGEKRLNYVIDEAEKWLAKYNIKLDIDELKAIIESEVLKINQQNK